MSIGAIIPPAARALRRKEGVYVHGLTPPVATTSRPLRGLEWERGRLAHNCKYMRPGRSRSQLFQPVIGYCGQIGQAHIAAGVNIGPAAIGAAVTAGQSPVTG